MLLLERAEQPTAVAMNGVPVFKSDVSPRVEPAAAAVAAALALGEALAAQVAEHGRAADAEMAGDRPPRPALTFQRPHSPVRGEVPLPALGGQLFRLGLGLGQRHGDAAQRGGFDVTTGLLNGAQVARVGGESYFQRLGQVLQQVEAVRDLHGCGRAVAGALGICAGTVARDHCDPGVLAQPS